MTTASTGADEYVLGRDMHGSVRLDAQHLLWKLRDGCILNAKIPIRPDMKIAEIGTGTGIWLLDLAGLLPKTVQLDGFDVSDSQYPCPSLLPQNVQLNVLDAFGGVPHQLESKYDIVHLRFWCCVVRGDDPSRLMRHVHKLLKPGGYIQWEDAHLGQNIVKGPTAEKFGSLMERFYEASHIKFAWLGSLDQRARELGWEVIEFKSNALSPSLIPLCTNTYLTGHFELFRAVRRLNNQGSLLPDEEDCQQLLLSLFADTKKGALYHWMPVTLLARKPFSLA